MKGVLEKAKSQPVAVCRGVTVTPLADGVMIEGADPGGRVFRLFLDPSEAEHLSRALRRILRGLRKGGD